VQPNQESMWMSNHTNTTNKSKLYHSQLRYLNKKLKTFPNFVFNVWMGDCGWDYYC